MKQNYTIEDYTQLKTRMRAEAKRQTDKKIHY